MKKETFDRLMNNLEAQIQNVQNTTLAGRINIADFDTRRDIDQETGHPTLLQPEDFQRLWERNDAASRIVKIYPEEAWKAEPQIYETEDKKVTAFEEAWTTLEKEKKLFSVLQRANTLARIGRFGVIVLGLADNQKDLRQPVNPKDGMELLFARPLEESCVRINKWNIDTSSPRFDQPELYSIVFSRDADGYGQSQKTTEVHWSRVVHINDDKYNSDVFGMPAMQQCFNRLLDLRKIASSSGEMFYKGAFGGLSIETHPPSAAFPGTPQIDMTATKEQMFKYMNGLQRYLVMSGATAKSLNVNISDPWPHAELQLKLIALCAGVPWRIFIGSEAAQLASQQDSMAWNARISNYRESKVSPFVIEPFLDRLISLGVLPTPAEYTINWPKTNMSSEKEKSETAKNVTEALAKYTQSGAENHMTLYHFLTEVLKYEDKTANAIVEAAQDMSNEIDAEDADTGLNDEIDDASQ